MLKLDDKLNIFNHTGKVVVGNHGYYLNFNIPGNKVHGLTCDEIAHIINPKVSSFKDLLEEDNAYDGLYIIKSKLCYFPEFDSLEKLEKFIKLITHKKHGSNKFQYFKYVKIRSRS